MAKCVDNERVGRIGCGAEYNGELQHCVAKVPWSKFPDGRAHITARSSTIDVMWERGTDHYPADPATIDELQINGYGYWVRPMRESSRAWAESKLAERQERRAQTATFK